MSVVREKVAICYTCSGETYRKSAYDKITNFYSDDENLYYFILTDDKGFFRDIKRKNLIVNEFKDFYGTYPNIEKFEKVPEVSSIEEYAKTFLHKGYLFSFSLMRLHLIQAIEYGITNITMISTDSTINPKTINTVLHNKNTIYNAVSEWDESIKKWGMEHIQEYLKLNYSYDTGDTVRVLDAAARLFIFDNIKSVTEFFTVWNNILSYLYNTEKIKIFRGPYVIHDEYILAPLYKMFGLTNKNCHACTKDLFEVKHAILKERYWATLGHNGLKDHYNYEEFLKINNLNNG